MRLTAALLASLDVITHETQLMLVALDAADGVPPERLRETRVQVEELRAKAQELLDVLSEVRLEEATH